MIQCRDIDELMVDFLYQELDSAQVEAFRAHVDGCKRCGDELASLSRTRQALRAWPEIEPSAAVTARLLHEAARHAKASPVAAGDPGNGQERGFWAWLGRLWQPVLAHPAWAAAASLVLVAGLAALLTVNKHIVSEKVAARGPAEVRDHESVAPAAPAASAPEVVTTEVKPEAEKDGRIALEEKAAARGEEDRAARLDGDSLRGKAGQDDGVVGGLAKAKDQTARPAPEPARVASAQEEQALRQPKVATKGAPPAKAMHATSDKPPPAEDFSVALPDQGGRPADREAAKKAPPRSETKPKPAQPTTAAGPVSAPEGTVGNDGHYAAEEGRAEAKKLEAKQAEAKQAEKAEQFAQKPADRPAQAAEGHAQVAAAPPPPPVPPAETPTLTVKEPARDLSRERVVVTKPSFAPPPPSPQPGNYNTTTGANKPSENRGGAGTAGEVAQQDNSRRAQGQTQSPPPQQTVQGQRPTVAPSSPPSVANAEPAKPKSKKAADTRVSYDEAPAAGAKADKLDNDKQNNAPAAPAPPDVTKLHEQARQKAAAGNCAESLSIRHKISRVDPEYYRRRVVGDQSFAACDGTDRKATKAAPASPSRNEKTDDNAVDIKAAH